MIASWKLPLIVVAIAAPVVAAFMLGGPALGVAGGALVAVAIVVLAARQRPREPIGSPAGDTAGRHILLVVTAPVEEPGEVAAIAREAGLGGEQWVRGRAAPVPPAEAEPEVLVLVPASIGFLDRWASDVEGARERAQEKLVATVAALAKAGIPAEARVGDEDVVQAVEDTLGSFPADEVVYVSRSGPEAESAGEAAAELGSRLRAEFRHLVLDR